MIRGGGSVSRAARIARWMSVGWVVCWTVPASPWRVTRWRRCSSVAIRRQPWPLARSAIRISNSASQNWTVEPRFAYASRAPAFATRGPVPVAARGRDAIAVLSWDASEANVGTAAASGRFVTDVGSSGLLVLSVAHQEPLVFPARADVECAQVSFQSVARHAGVSRHRLFTQRAGGRRSSALRNRSRASSDGILTTQLASEASLRQRLETLRADKQRLRDENAALKHELAMLHGAQRAADEPRARDDCSTTGTRFP